MNCPNTVPELRRHCHSSSAGTHPTCPPGCPRAKLVPRVPARRHETEGLRDCSSVTAPGPRKALIVPQDSTQPLLERQAREKEPGALPMRPMSSFAVVLAVTVLRERSATLQLLRKVRAQTIPQLGVSSLQKMAEDTFFLFGLLVGFAGGVL